MHGITHALCVHRIAYKRRVTVCASRVGSAPCAACIGVPAWDQAWDYTYTCGKSRVRPTASMEHSGRRQPRRRTSRKRIAILLQS